MPYLLDNDDFGDRLYWDQITEKHIKELRQCLEQWTERHELCYAEDLRRVVEDDDYCRMIVCQMRMNMAGAKKFMLDMLRWRRAMNLKDLSEETLPKAVLERGIIYPYGRDKSGSHVLVVQMKNYVKGVVPRDSAQKIFLFFVETLFNKCGAKKVTLLLDCSDVGVANVDVELLKFLVDVFIAKYPIGLGNALIYNMPWIFNAILKMITSILPFGAERLKPVNKSGIQQYIDTKHLPLRMGGMDTYEYSYVAGNPLGDRHQC
uniref:Putative phosphatidylinositol transfer protein pdr16 n=1 Tax=Amblyomma triste TaxID=251400 RepID=A0A023G496_AMBTT